MKDKQPVMRRWQSCCLALVAAYLVLALFPTAAAAGNYAILVGVDYVPEGHKWADDAVNLRAALINDPNWVGDNIILRAGNAVIDVKEADIMGDIAMFAPGGATPLGEGDSLLFYYSGHGSGLLEANHEGPPGGTGPSPPRDNRDETLYISPGVVGGQIQDDELTAALGVLDPKVNVLAFLDACFSGGFWRGESSTSPAGGNTGDLENLPTTSIMAAAGEQQMAPGSSDFTNKFIADLADNAFDLDAMNRADLFATYKRIKTDISVVANRKFDPNYPDPSLYDPLSFTYDEQISSQSVFYSNVPEPDSLLILAVGLIGCGCYYGCRRQS